MKRLILSGSICAVLLMPLCIPRVQAAVETWVGGTNLWDTAGNWSGTNTPPQSGDSLVFGAAGAGGLNLNNDYTTSAFNLAGITFNVGAAAFVIGDGTAADTNAGNTFTLTGNVTNNSNSLETINNSFALGTIATFTTTTGGGNITLGGNVGGGGGITASGGGTLRLSGANIFTGATTVTSGTLIFSGTNTGSAATVKGGTLEVDYSTGATGNILDASKVLTLAGNGATFLVNGGTSPQTQTFAGLAIQAGSNTIALTTSGGATSLVFTGGTITRATGATLNFTTPPGTMITLAGNNSNPFLGPWAFFNGIGYAATGPSGAVQAAVLTPETTPGINGLTSASTNYAYTSPGSPDLQTIPAATANTVTFTTASPQTLDLGANTLTANGFANNGAALTIQSGSRSGTLAIGNTGELVIGGSGNVTVAVPIVNRGATPSVLTVANTGVMTLTGANTYSGGTRINAGTLQIGNGLVNGTFGSGQYVIGSGATLKLNYATLVTAPIWANISGPGTLDLNITTESDWAGGPGQQLISLPAAFTGTLQIESGRVAPNGVAGLGGTTAIIIGNGGQLATFNGGTFPQNFTIAGTGWGEVGYESALRLANSGATTALTGSVTLSASATIGATGTGILAGPISGPGNATLTVGTRTVYAVNDQEGGVAFTALNTYTGATIIPVGILQLSGINGANAGSTSYTINGTLQLNNLSSAGGNNNNRINDTATLALVGGSFLDQGADSTNSTETIGAITSSGSSAIAVNPASGHMVTLTATSLVHTPGSGSILIFGSNLGADSSSNANIGRFFVNLAPSLVGGAAPTPSGINAAAQNTQIVPYLVGEANSSSGGLGTVSGTANTFVTYNVTTGFRPLNPTDEFTQNAITSGNNTRITSATTAAASATINSLVIAGGNLSIATGQTLTDLSGALLFTSANTISSVSSTGTLAFGAAEGMITVNSGVTATISAPVTGSGGLTKGGAGTLVLSGTNSYTGGLTVSGGILQVTTAAAIPASVVVNGNGTFDVNGQSLQSPAAVSFTISGIGAKGSPGALANTSASEGSVANLTLAGDAQIGSSNNKLNIYGSTINLAGRTLTVAGGATTDIRTDNSIQGTGSIVAAFGTLRFESSQAGTAYTLVTNAFSTIDTFGNRTIAANVLLNGGTVANASGSSLWSGAVTVAAPSTIDDRGNQIALTGTVSGTGSITKMGNGTVTLAGNNTYTGGTTVSAGTLVVTQASMGAKPLGTGTVTLAGGTLSVQGAQSQLAGTGWNADVVHGTNESTANFGTNSTVDGVGFIFYGSGSAGAPQKGLPVDGAVVNPANGELFQLQSYTANNDIRLSTGNSATFALSAPTSVNSLHIANTGGNGAATYSFTLNFADGSSTTVNGQTAPDWFNNTPFIASDFGRATQAGAYDNRAGNPRLYENVYTLSAADAAKVLSSITFTSNSGGILNVFGVTANVPTQSYANNLSVTANSTLNVQNTTSATFGSLAIGGNTLSVTGSSGATATLGNVTLSGNATFSPAAGMTLTLGAVGEDASSRSLTQAGAGTLVLTGTSTYSGSTSVNSGTLVVRGSLSGTNVTSVSTGATLLVAAGGDVGGAGVANSGTVTGAGSIEGLLLTTGGKVAPGAGPLGVGTLTAGSLSLDSASTLSFTLAGTGPGQFSQISSGDVELNADFTTGAILSLTLAGGYLPAAGDMFMLILSGSAPDGMFGNAQTSFIGGSTYGFSMAGQQWEINYSFPGSQSGSGMNASDFAAATGGNYVAIMAVPEPDSLGLLVSAIGVTLGLQRLRRCAL